ncbi:MAG TPA: DUF4388 domain-containing protein [Polyangiaceae bacterium]|nr:DUF4388 domain-containing protein [Polyangiaceae bacterium]
MALLAKSAVAGGPPPLPEPESDQEERTRLWLRSLGAQAKLEGGTLVANDFRSSGVFQRSAGQECELAASSCPSSAAPAVEPSAASSPAALFMAPLTELALADLLQILQWLRRSAVIRIARDETDTHIWCESGEVIDAESGRLRGQAAVHRALGFEHGAMIAELRASDRERTIFAPTHRLVLEAARRNDEAGPLRRAIGDEQRPLRCVRKRAPAGLRPKELELFQSFKTPRSAQAALQASELGDFETLKLIARWVQTGELVPVTGTR